MENAYSIQKHRESAQKVSDQLPDPSGEFDPHRGDKYGPTPQGDVTTIQDVIGAAGRNWKKVEAMRNSFNFPSEREGGTVELKPGMDSERLTAQMDVLIAEAQVIGEDAKRAVEHQQALEQKKMDGYIAQLDLPDDLKEQGADSCYSFKNDLTTLAQNEIRAERIGKVAKENVVVVQDLIRQAQEFGGFGNTVPGQESTYSFRHASADKVAQYREALAKLKTFQNELGDTGVYYDEGERTERRTGPFEKMVTDTRVDRKRELNEIVKIANQFASDFPEGNRRFSVYPDPSEQKRRLAEENSYTTLETIKERIPRYQAESAVQNTNKQIAV